MSTNYRISTFITLGEQLTNALRAGTLKPILEKATEENAWFTQASIRTAIQAICENMLQPEALNRWLANYPIPNGFTPKNVGVVMAGNVPLVGFFDLMCVCICGHRCRVKYSSKDRVLMEWIVRTLQQIDPSIDIEPLAPNTPIDALIVSGSDSTLLHFQKQYDELPCLLRGTRHSLAVLSGTESPEQLDGLAEDIFLYFGLGCRNVSRLFVPTGYDLNTLCTRLAQHPVSHRPYLNNYRQSRAIRTMNGTPMIDGGFFLLCKEEGDDNRISEIAYSTYDTLGEVERWIADHDDRIQCIVSEVIRHPRRTGFGQAQHPSLTDYPDGIDVIDFLLRI